MLRSAYIRFSRRFSSSMALAIVLGPMADYGSLWLISDASMPPYFARHL